MSSVANTVSQAANTAMEKVKSGAADVKDKVVEFGANVKDKVQHAAANVAETATEKLHDLKETAGEYCGQGLQQAKKLSHNVEDYVRREPVKSVLIAAGVGFALGFLLIRK